MPGPKRRKCSGLPAKSFRLFVGKGGPTMVGEQRIMKFVLRLQCSTCVLVACNNLGHI